MCSLSLVPNCANHWQWPGPTDPMHTTSQVTRGGSIKALRLALQAGRASRPTGRLQPRQQLQLQGHLAAGWGSKSRRESRQPGHMCRSNPAPCSTPSRIMPLQLQRQHHISRGGSVRQPRQQLIGRSRVPPLSLSGFPQRSRGTRMRRGVLGMRWAGVIPSCCLPDHAVLTSMGVPWDQVLWTFPKIGKDSWPILPAVTYSVNSVL